MENPPVEAEAESTPKFPEHACQNCGHDEPETHYDFKLCTNCRNELSNLQIPKWLQLTAGGVLLALVLSIFIGWGSFMTFITYKKAEKAFDEKKFETAARYYSQVKAKDYEMDLEVNSKRLLCYYHNFNIDSCSTMLNYLSQKSYEDMDLFGEVESTSGNLSLYFSTPADSLTVPLEQIPTDSLVQRQILVENYLKKDSLSLAAIYLLGDIYYDEKEFDKAVKMLEPKAQQYPEFQSIPSLLIACYRELKQYDKAIEWSNNLLMQNQESVIAYAALSKVELKRKNDSKAMEYASMAYSIDSTHYLSLSTMALATHFNNKKKASEEYFHRYESVASDQTSVKYYRDLVSPTSNWRN